MDLSQIKTQLKAWEAEFRAENGGREPGKADIKAVPSIAAKYKQYRDLKGSKPVPVAPRTTSSSRASSSRATSTGAPPLASTSSAQRDTSSVFKTPTKPKYGQSSTRDSPIKVTPSKSKDNNNSNSKSKPTYVIANSPIKLRAAIASASSQRSSPNKPTRGSASATLLDAIPSPKRNSVAGGGSDLDDMGMAGSEDHDSFFRRGGESPLKKKSPSRMIIDSDDGRTEGANISGGGKTSRVSKEEELRIFKEMLGDEDDFMMEDDDDETFGPSPVKPSANGISKTFTPLFPDEPSKSLTLKPNKPTLFSTSIPSRSQSSTSLLPTVQSVASSTNSTLPRTLKRPLESDKSTGQTGTSTSESKGKGKAKATAAVTKTRQPKRTKFSELVVEPEQHDEEMAEGSAPPVKEGTQSRRRNQRGQIILEPYKDGKKGEVAEAIVVYSRKSQRSKRKEGGGPVEDDENEDEKEIQDPLYYRSTTAILSTRQENRPAAHDEDSEQGSDASPQPTRSRTIDRSISIDSSIPSELVSMLSIRSSPIKKTALLRERDRDLRVKKLLREPSAIRKQSSGLADLELGSEEDEGEGEGDDDWDSDAEGWKDLGDGAMDGYDDSS